MNESLKKAVDGFVSLNGASLFHSDEGQQWIKDNCLDITDFDNISLIEKFFKIVSMIGKDDKYVCDKILIRHTPQCNPSSYFISLFERYDIRELVVTVESNVYFISAMLARGYHASSIKIDLTDKWGGTNYFSSTNVLTYGTAILLTKD